MTNDVQGHDEDRAPAALGTEEPATRGPRRPPRPTDPLAPAMARVAAGDREAFGEVYDALMPKVLGLARGVVRNHAMAEEVAQDVMLEVWRKAPRFDPSMASASTWAMTIAHRRAVDRVRSVRSSEDREDRVASWDVRREYDDVVETAEQHEDERMVRSALSTLTDLQSEDVELAYWGGCTSSEISERLGVPVPTVKTRLRDGLMRLRAGMGATS